MEAAVGRWALLTAGGGHLSLQLPSTRSREYGVPFSHVLHPCRSPPKFQGWERRWLWARVWGPGPASLPPSLHPLSMCSLFVPVVNLEKMSSLPKPDGHGIRVAPPSAFLSQPAGLTKDSPGKNPMASPSKELPGRGSIEITPSEGSSHRAEGSPSEKEPGGARLPPKTHRKMARE